MRMALGPFETPRKGRGVDVARAATVVTDALAPGKRASRAAPGRLDLSGVSILIVEDNDDSRDMLRQMVESFGASVRTARYGREAIALVAAEKTDIVLCDLVMPGVDGFQFMGWLRRQPAELARIPVIAVTALGRATDFQRTFEMGFAGHLLKPIDHGLIEAQLRRVFLTR